MFGGAHTAAQCVHHKLQSVTDAEHWHAELEYLGISCRRIFVINGGWSPRQNDAYGQLTANLLKAAVAGKNYGIDTLLAHSPGNQLRILRAEIENDDGWSFHG